MLQEEQQEGAGNAQDSAIAQESAAMRRQLAELALLVRQQAQQVEEQRKAKAEQDKLIAQLRASPAQSPQHSAPAFPSSEQEEQLTRQPRAYDETSQYLASAPPARKGWPAAGHENPVSPAAPAQGAVATSTPSQRARVAQARPGAARVVARSRSSGTGACCRRLAVSLRAQGAALAGSGRVQWRVRRQARRLAGRARRSHRSVPPELAGGSRLRGVASARRSAAVVEHAGSGQGDDLRRFGARCGPARALPAHHDGAHGARAAARAASGQPRRQ